MWYNAYTLMQKVGSVRKPMLSLSVSEAVAVASVAAVFACCPVRAAAADEAAFADEGELTPLVVAKGELRPFAEQHDICAFAVPWFDSAGRDLVCEGSCFGSRPLIYRFLRIERGAPVYADGVPYDGPSPRNAAPWHGVDGSFSLCRVEKGALVRYRFDRAAKAFGRSENVLGADGKPYRHSGDGIAFADVDGDGIEDLLSFHVNVERGGDASCTSGFPWPKMENGKRSPWTDIETPYSGIGRGYDVFGRWMGTENIAEIHWAKGTKAADGSPRFASARPVYVDMPDFPDVKRILTWKMYRGIMGAAVIDAPSGRHLIIGGDMDRIATFKIVRVAGGDVFCGSPQPLLESGYTIPHSYWTHGIHALDIDGDGRKELLLDGNPGTIAVLKGGEPRSWTSTRALIEGGAICGETLSSAARYDWNHDGFGDIILADASGWMTFWGGTANPLVYKGARDFTVEGSPFRLKAGRSGSLQGTAERMWGYVKVIAGKWGGMDAIITVDIRGDLLLHRRAKGINPLALAPAQAFRHPDGRPFKVAWRSRPDFAPAGFAGAPRPSLVIMDLDGDIALAVPESDGSLVISDVRKLKNADGSNMHLCGINGLWGRGHIALVDWDGDGKEDIVFGTNRSCHRFFCDDKANGGGMPFFFKNTGTRAQPAFAAPATFRLAKCGKRLAFGWHNATPWATDLDGDKRPDLLVSAENGKVYAFRHDDISTIKERTP